MGRTITLVCPLQEIENVNKSKKNINKWIENVNKSIDKINEPGDHLKSAVSCRCTAEFAFDARRSLRRAFVRVKLQVN